MREIRNIKDSAARTHTFGMMALTVKEGTPWALLAFVLDALNGWKEGGKEESVSMRKFTKAVFI